MLCIVHGLIVLSPMYSQMFLDLKSTFVGIIQSNTSLHHSPLDPVLYFISTTLELILPWKYVCEVTFTSLANFPNY